MRLWVLLAWVLGLVGCGGSGGEDSSAPEGSQVIELSLLSRQVGDTYPIQIYLPAGAQSSGHRYAAMVVLDPEWHFSNTIRLLGDEAQRTIVIGIGNTAQRNRDYVPPNFYSGDRDLDHGAADRFFNFIRLELMPQLERDYPIDPARRMLFGHSLGGLFAQYASLIDDPNQRAFIGYLASDATNWNGGYMRQLEAQLAASGGHSPVRLYCGAASGGNNTLARSVCDEMAASPVSGFEVAAHTYPGDHNSVVQSIQRDGFAWLFRAAPL
jgi:predicted alpha/beta superfamily hydrolase